MRWIGAVGEETISPQLTQTPKSSLRSAALAFSPSEPWRPEFFILSFFLLKRTTMGGGIVPCFFSWRDGGSTTGAVGGGDLEGENPISSTHAHRNLPLAHLYFASPEPWRPEFFIFSIFLLKTTPGERGGGIVPFILKSKKEMGKSTTRAVGDV